MKIILFRDIPDKRPPHIGDLGPPRIELIEIRFFRIDDHKKSVLVLMDICKDEPTLFCKGFRLINGIHRNYFGSLLFQ